MYPAYLRSLLKPPAALPRIFVAMPFSDTFDRRYETVIAPAIGRLQQDGKVLTPHRVDRGNISDSLIVEIMDGIQNDLLVFADITTIGLVDDKPVRNHNVMYEVGIAHAIRPPEDVLLFRSDKDNLPFDVSGIRVRSYEPDANPDAAIALLAAAFKDAVKASRLIRRQVVEHAVAGLDWHAFTAMLTIQGFSWHESSLPPREALLATDKHRPLLERLLSLGLLRTTIKTVAGRPGDSPLVNTREMFEYELTPLGNEVVLLVSYRSGMIASSAQTFPELLPHLERLRAELDDA